MKDEKGKTVIQGHTTEHEIKFLNGLGNYKAQHKIPLVDVLRGYINGAAGREDWGDINKDQVISHAVKLLSTLYQEPEINDNTMLII